MFKRRFDFVTKICINSLGFGFGWQYVSSAGFPTPTSLASAARILLANFAFFTISRQFASKTMAKTFQAKLDAGANFFYCLVPLSRGCSSIG